MFLTGCVCPSCHLNLWKGVVTGSVISIVDMVTNSFSPFQKYEMDLVYLAINYQLFRDEQNIIDSFGYHCLVCFQKR
jgi:hypothetical protein